MGLLVNGVWQDNGTTLKRVMAKFCFVKHSAFKIPIFNKQGPELCPDQVRYPFNL